MARSAVAVVLAVALALASCGGDGEDAERSDAQQAVRDFVKATNERDGDALCGELLTDDYLRKATGATGDDAEEACREQLDLLSGLRLKLVSIGRTRVDGDEATVRAVIVTAGQRAPRMFSLTKEDGRWKLSGGSAG